MERPVVFPWFPFLLFMWLKSASAQNEVVYVKFGGTISLKPESSGPFTNILWKHNGDPVVQWVNDALGYYGKFVGRTTLDIKTGGLVIKNTDDSFMGPYTVELNSQPQAKGYMVEFIKEVTKRQVDQKPPACFRDLETCRLVCFHHDSSAFGRLTHSCRDDGGDWKHRDKNKIIMNDQDVETFSCLVKNAVSEAVSDAYENLFCYPALNKPIWITTSYFALKVLVVWTFLGLSGYFIRRKREMKQKCPRQEREKTVKYEGPCTVHVL